MFLYVAVEVISNTPFVVFQRLCNIGDIAQYTSNWVVRYARQWFRQQQVVD